MTVPIRTLVVDDEPIARRGLRRLLGERGDIEIVGECANGEHAVEVIRRIRPELVYLDIQMPGLDGFDVLRTIGTEAMPCVVFVTAFDEHALAAFAAAATDYVVKPYSPERIREATDRALRRIREHRVVAAHEQLLSALGRPAELHQPARVGESHATRFLVQIGARTVIVPVAEVSVIEADGYHVRLVVGYHRHVLRESLKELELRLDPLEFVRVHRSAIVRMSAVESLERTDSDQLTAVMADGMRIPVSRARRDEVLRQLRSIRG